MTIQALQSSFRDAPALLSSTLSSHGASHTVKQGETLGAIARQYGTSVESLMAANSQIVNPDVIHPGDQVRVPANDTPYVVQPGDSLSAIAAEHGVSVQALIQTNGIHNADMIYPGDRLSIPAASNDTENRPTPPAGQPEPQPTQAGEMPQTGNLSEARKFDLYAGYVNQFGDARIQQDLNDGNKVAIALRDATSTHANQGRGLYDDRMVVIWQDNNGTKHVEEMRANTDPSGQYEDGGPHLSRTPTGADVDGDGQLDLGRLAEGTYRFTRGEFLGNEAYRSTNDQVAERDVNHNGRFDDGVSQSGNFGMHIHIGGGNNTWSAGCLTLEPSEHQRFFDTLGNQATLHAVVIDSANLPPAETPQSEGTDTLTLGANERYRADIEFAADRTGLPKAVIAAVINAEAAKDANGVWDPDSANGRSSARGLTQFLSSTWIGEATKPGTHLNQYARDAGYVDGNNQVVDGHKQDLLDLRFTPRLAITAAAEYDHGIFSRLEREGRIPAGAEDQDLARYLYIGHHEGLGGARQILPPAGESPSLSDSRAQQLFDANANDRTQQKYLQQNGNDVSQAYIAWLNDYIDYAVNPGDFD